MGCKEPLQRFNATHAQRVLYPVLFGPCFGQSAARFLKTGRVRLADVRVEAMPADLAATAR